MTLFEKTQQLKKHKRIATGLFIFMMIVYVTMVYLSSLNTSSWIGYVQSFSEAAMVGALADWFAVTALFHHPLGLKIPHTNIIEKSKQSIGDNLGDFVVDNFLNPETIRPYIEKITITTYLANWLNKKKNQDVFSSEIKFLVKDIIDHLEDEKVALFIADKGKEFTEKIKLTAIAAEAISYFIKEKEHEKLITLIAGKIKGYIKENEALVTEKVTEESYFFIPKFVDKKIASKIANGLVNYFAEIEENPKHRIREDITKQIILFGERLTTEEKWESEFDKLKNTFLADEQIRKYAFDIWNSIKNTLYRELATDDSALNTYINKALANISEKLEKDKVLQPKIDHWIQINTYKLLLKNTKSVSEIISTTVGTWEGRDLSNKLELEVGKDLQFIRINGTLVGGLVGLTLHFLTQLFI